MPTMVATGMRRPRMHGTPSICLGSTVIRLSLSVLSVAILAILCHARPPVSTCHTADGSSRSLTAAAPCRSPLALDNQLLSQCPCACVDAHQVDPDRQIAQVKGH